MPESAIYRNKIVIYTCASRIVLLTIFICLGCTFSNRLLAHPISLSSVLIDIGNQSIAVEVTIYVEDLALFYWQDVDQSFRQSAVGYQRRAVEHADFLLRHLHLLDENGKRLQGTVKTVDSTALEGVGIIAFDQLMEYTLRYELLYPLDQVPQYLSVMQDFGGEHPAIPSEMEVRFFLHTIQVEQTMLSHRAMHTVDIAGILDGGIDGEDLKTVQARLRERHDGQLGISSYSKVYHYLYINERGVRHEWLIPLLQLDEWLTLPGARGRVLEVTEQQALHAPIRDFLNRYQRLEINDGQQLPMSALDIRFFGPGVRDLATLTDAAAVTVHNARVGIIAEYATEQPVREVAFHWGYYAARYPFFEAFLYPYDEPREFITLYSQRIPLRWQDPDWSQRIRFLPVEPPLPLSRLSLPILSCVFIALALVLSTVAWRSADSPCLRRLYAIITLLLFASALPLRNLALWQPVNPLQAQPEPAVETLNELASNLLQNIYQAFSFADEVAIYDALSESVGGSLLRTLYLDVRRSIINRDQGGAVARIHEVVLLEAILRDMGSTIGGWPTLEIEGEWTVLGSVEHWGHVHTRKNLHRAVIGLVGSDSGWRVQRFEPLTEERVEESIGVRR